jgi:hypothetical protein
VWKRRRRAGLLVLVLLVAAPPAALAAFTGVTSNAASSFTAAATFPTYPQAVLADNPVAYYRADDAAGSASAADSSGGGNTGVYVTPTTGFQAPGSPAGGSVTADTALAFPAGASATVSANFSQNSPDTFTTEVWFKTASTTAQRLYQFADSASGNVTTTDRMVSMNAAGQVSLVVSTTTVSSAASYNDGTWHLVSASLGAAGMRLYVDGSLAGSDASVTAGLTISPGFWRLGGQSGLFFTGTLDEASIFSSQLGDAQIAAHYTAGTTATTLAQYSAAVTADSPWAFLHLDDAPLSAYQGDTFPTPAADAGGLGNIATIFNIKPKGMVGGGSGALVGPEAASTSMHFLGAGFGYDPTTYANPAAWSEELWFRSTSSNGGLLFQFTASATGFPSRYDRMAYLSNAGRITYGVYSGGVNSVTSSASYNDGAWHHVVGTGGPGGLTLYVDGLLVAANTAITTGENTTGHFRWGGGNTNWGARPTSDYLVGDIDEVAFYLTQLNSQQVAWHYHANH